MRSHDVVVELVVPIDPRDASAKRRQVAASDVLIERFEGDVRGPIRMA